MKENELQIGDLCKVKGTDKDFFGNPLKPTAKGARWRIVRIDGDCISLGNGRTGKAYHYVHRDYIVRWKKGGE